jgi:hypothetical protein
MAADLILSYWMTIAGRAAVLVFFFAVATVVVCVLFIFVCNIEVKEWWQSPRMRLSRLGGVTTLRRKLNYTCTLCQDSMEVGEKVRTLSCGHAFHCDSTIKCERGIDQWLLTGEAMSWQSCPICRQDPHPMLPWKRPPPSSPTHSPEASAPALAQLLPPAHDETLPEASSSASAPPLAQLPRTSAPDLEEASPLLVHDETLPESSSSQ